MQFDLQETAMLAALPASQLALSLLESDPVVALRGIAEVMLNGDEEKLVQLLTNDALTAHWQKYEQDFMVDARDFAYALQFAKRQRELKDKLE